MIFILATGLVVAGLVILVWALVPARRLMASLPAGSLHNRWYAMTALIGLFLAGYLAYLIAFWNRHSSLLDLIVPAIFFFGAGFVWLTARLSLQTAMDLMHTTRLEWENVTDPLTSIHNRRYLDRRLVEEIARSRRYDLPLSLVFLDIDHFKHINDTYGHPAGDQVLVSIAQLVSNSLRDTDLFARFGGEEFVVITPHTALADATETAGRLLKTIEAHRFDLADAGTALRVTCSAGVAALGKEGGSAELLAAADNNLYRAKQEGRNRVIASMTASTSTEPSPG